MQLKLNASRLQDAALHILRPTQQVKCLRETAVLLGSGTSYAKTAFYECCMIKSFALSDHESILTSETDVLYLKALFDTALASHLKN